MQLRELVAALPERSALGNLDVEIRAIQTDSRRVQPGDLFVAYRGVNLDLHSFVPQAVLNGAVAIMIERYVEAPPHVARVVVPSGRAAWAMLAAAWHGFPSRRFPVVGVTGTDGKTTTSALIGAILAAAGRKVGLVTTVAAKIGGVEVDTGFHTTTPEPPEIQAYMANMAEQGTEVAVVETTSHALALDKVAGVDYDVAVVTNVTHEHLDFHGTWEAYLESKARLFDGLAGSFRKAGVAKVAVLNRDDASYARLVRAKADRRIEYSTLGRADVAALGPVLTPKGTQMVVATPVGPIDVSTRLLGAFNVENTLAAIGAALALAVPADAIQRGLAEFRGVPGRLEAVDLGQPFGVVIDFAHTPNSLRRVLQLGRTLSPSGKLSVVFGCAGLRDVAKRPLMGRAAGDLADRVYLTAEDPRTEELGAIIEQIAEGVRAGGKEPRVEPDRAVAIRRALAEAQPGDLVLITGKGHEQTMCFGAEERPWSDRAAAESALTELGHSSRRAG